MKVRIETEAAARTYGCEIGDFRDLQRQDAGALIESGDVSETAETAEQKPVAKRKPAAKTKAGK